MTAVIDFMMAFLTNSRRGAVIRFHSHAFAFIHVRDLRSLPTTQHALLNLPDGCQPFFTAVSFHFR
ncbi:hypothetical protein ABT448_004027 [Salmonella enterica subsp. enterica serovar Brandenburg]